LHTNTRIFCMFPVEALWKWVYSNLAVKENGSSDTEVSKNQLFEELLISLGLQGDGSKTKVSRLLAVKAFSFLFPEFPQAVEEFKDPQASTLRNVRLVTGSEREARASSVPPLTDEFKRGLLNELRTEITRRTSSNVANAIVAKAEEETHPAVKRKAASPPESPGSKRQKIASRLTRRSSSESSLFGAAVSANAVPTISKLEQQIANLEQKQAALQVEISDLRYQLQQLREAQSEPVALASTITTRNSSKRASESVDDIKPTKVTRKRTARGKKQKRQNPDFEYDDDKDDSDGTFQETEKEASTEGSPKPASPPPISNQVKQPLFNEITSLADAATALSNGAEVPGKASSRTSMENMNAALMMAFNTSLNMNSMNLGSAGASTSATSPGAVIPTSIPIMPVVPPAPNRFSPPNTSNPSIYSSSWNPYSLSSGTYITTSNSSNSLFSVPLSTIPNSKEHDLNSPSPLPTKLSQETLDSQVSSQET